MASLIKDFMERAIPLLGGRFGLGVGIEGPRYFHLV